jgi:hypothetical protein
VNEQAHLRNIYRLYVEWSRERSALVEAEIGFDESIGISLDDRRNEPESYKALFRDAYSPLIHGLYESLMRSIRSKRFEDCEDEFAGIAFLTAMIMKALGVYQADRSNPLAKFANEFDRLDVLAVKRKLYEMAQA